MISLQHVGFLDCHKNPPNVVEDVPVTMDPSWVLGVFYRILDASASTRGNEFLGQLVA